MNTQIPLGTPIPDVPHSVSVSFPDWKDMVDYEEGDLNLHNQLRSGYPRFVYHRAVKSLVEIASREFGTDCLPFPTESSAQRCVSFLMRSGVRDATLRTSQKWQAIFFAAFPNSAAATAKAYWTHSGEGISSRQAEALGESISESLQAKENIRRRLASWIPACESDDVYLFPTGMAAIYQAYRLIQNGKKSLQLGFPYVDTLKVQTVLGDGADHLLDDSPRIPPGPEGGYSAVFCEFPSNPLMKCLDLEAIQAQCHALEIPLIVDDSINHFYGHRFAQFGDIRITSLTKLFSGKGNAMGGALILNRTSPFYKKLKASLAANYTDTLWCEDAIVLENNSRDFTSRFDQISLNTKRVLQSLQKNPNIEKIYFPERCDGFPMFSVVLKNAATVTPEAYNAMTLAKGPSFGLNQTLVCAYTLLAHFHELDWAKKCGVDPYLLRISVGLESPEETLKSLNL